MKNLLFKRLKRLVCVALAGQMVMMSLAGCGAEPATDTSAEMQQETTVDDQTDVSDADVADVDEQIDSMMGQVLVIYTDGVNEAENSDMARFGDDRLLELLNGNDNHTAKQIIDKIHENVALHVGDAEPSDDLTLLCLKMNGKASIHQETLQQ